VKVYQTAQPRHRLDSRKCLSDLSGPLDLPRVYLSDYIKQLPKSIKKTGIASFPKIIRDRL